MQYCRDINANCRNCSNFYANNKYLTTFYAAEYYKNALTRRTASSRKDCNYIFRDCKTRIKTLKTNNNSIYSLS